MPTRWFDAQRVLPAKVRELYPDLRQVRDATEPLRIRVRTSDIQQGEVKIAENCALSLACRRQQKCDAAIIRMRVAYLIFGTRAVRYKVPESVRRELVAFDRARAFEPGLYQLSVPIPSARLGEVRPRRTGPHRRSRTTSVQVLRHVTAGVRS